MTKCSYACPECGGTGKQWRIYRVAPVRCTYCKGSGRIEGAAPHIYRVRRTYSLGAGLPHHYVHADIPANSPREALRKAKTKQHPDVRWRWIDTFDKSDAAYETFTFLYRLTPARRKTAAKSVYPRT